MCLFPNNAKLDEFGKIKFTHEGDLRLPCGRCTECISKRALEWATRARHEISCHKENCFLTLTYDEHNLPSIQLVKDDFQKFMKRLRKKAKKPLRYMVSGEYGSKTFRPHFHAIIFGYNPPNQKKLKTTPKGETLFTSETISNLWDLGFHSIGTANEKTAYYIASYALKGKKHTLTCPHTGELLLVNDYMDCSKRPAIGLNYFEQNQNQLVNSGEILPRYYLKKLKDQNPTLHEHYENERALKLKTRGSHEIYAKYTLDQQKKNTIQSEFRSTPEKSQEDAYLKEHLKSTRDEYHHINKKDPK